MATGSNPNGTGSRRPAIRISVRALIGLVLVLGVGLGWIVHRARLQRDAVATIERAGGKVFYDFQVTGASGHPAWTRPKWLVDFLGVDSLAHVAMVQDDPFGGEKGLTDADMEAVGRLGRLETLTLWGSPGLTDAGLVHLRGLARLQRLEIAGGPAITGAGLAHVEGLARLEQLQFNNHRVADADLAHLSGLVRLRHLSLFLAPTSEVTDAGLAHLEPLRDLESLQIDGAGQITDAGLSHLGKLTNLRSLSLTNAPVTDLKGLEPLNSLTSLTLMGSPIDDAGLSPVTRLSGVRELELSGTRVTVEAIKATRAAHPGLRVIGP